MKGKILCETKSVFFKTERRRKLGLPAEDPDAPKPAAPVVEENKVSIKLFCS